MRKKPNNIRMSLLSLFIMAALLASCMKNGPTFSGEGEENEDTPAAQSKTIEDSQMEREFQPGNFTVITTGGMPLEEYENAFGIEAEIVLPILSEEEKAKLYQELNGKYPDSPVPVEESAALEEKIKDLTQQKTIDAFDAFCAGEADIIILDNPFLFHLLTHEGLAAPLDEGIGDLVSNGDYYEGIVNAGRIDGILYGIMPFCLVEGILVPKGAWEAAEGRNRSIGELSALYELLEPENRTGAVASTPFLLHEIARSWDDIEGEFVFSSERFADLFDFFSRMEASTKDYTGSPSTPDLFNPGVSIGIQNPAVWSIHFSDGTAPEHDYPSITKWGSDAAFVPYPDETEGFDSLGQVILISAKSEKKEACFAFLRWLLSPQVQEEAAPVTRGVFGTEFASPVSISAARKLAETMENNVPDHIKELLKTRAATVPSGTEIAEYYERIYSHAIRYGMTSSDWFEEEEFLRFMNALGSDKKRSIVGETPEEITKALSEKVSEHFALGGFQIITP